MSELKLKRHETFSIRIGWLEKGINKIAVDPFCFKKDDGPIKLGIGSNMVKSLRYWLIACGLAKFSSQYGATLTEFGRFLLEKDPYLEDVFSWWLIHNNLVVNKFGDTPVINYYFNMEKQKVGKESFFNMIKNDFETKYGSITSDNSLDSDISILFKSYYSDDFSNPENNLNCPLSNLGLIGMIDKKNYIKMSPQYEKLSYKIVFYSLVNCVQINNPGQMSIDFDSLYVIDNNPIKVFNLTKSMFFLYLEDMKKNGLINLVKTAGLNVITILKEINLTELYDI